MRTNLNITELNFSGNKFQDKAGIYFGKVLSDNPDYDIRKINFSGNNLEEYGFERILEAIKMNKNIRKVKLGQVTDYGLKKLAEHLEGNTHLKSLKFEENKNKPWTDVGI
jgi:hypothetical protein